MAETETIYARVPVDVKAAVEAYASDTGKSLTGAVSDLIQRGLGTLPGDQNVIYELRVVVGVNGVSELSFAPRS